MTIQALKQQTRKHLKSVLQTLSPEAQMMKSRLIAERLRDTRWWHEAEAIFAFCSMRCEVDTTLILNQAFEHVDTVGVPRIEGDRLVFHQLKGLDVDFCNGLFDIREPGTDWPVLDPGSLPCGNLLVITPGLAFDRCKHRLGRGKGFYDRFLGAARACDQQSVNVVGVCFAEQLIECVPVAAHDLPVDGIVTDQETIY